MATILDFKNVSKTFDAVKALQNVDFSLEEGEVHALVGENGAGKSTLIKILAGVHEPDKSGGSVEISGKAVTRFSPTRAQQLGVSVMYQELDMVPALTVIQNIILGREPKRVGQLFLDAKKAKADVEKLFKRLHLSVPLDIPIRDLSIAQQQITMIAKALSLDAKIIVMDEPTAALGEKDVLLLYDIVRQLKQDGISLIYISHRLDEIFQIADRVTVLRDGRKIITTDVKDITKEDLIRYMVGREIVKDDKLKVSVEQVNPIVEVSGVRTDTRLKNADFALYKGEILGIAGLAGSGRTELARAILGLDKLTAGTVKIDGKTIKPSMKNLLKEKIGYVPEDRKVQGILPNMIISSNTSVTTLVKKFSKLTFVSEKRERKEAAKALDTLDVRPRNYSLLIRNLSGGNQQKVVISRWLLADSRILIIDEPTRGIDVGAKEEIYNLLYQLRDNGCSIIMISSELPEIIRVSDRVAVMAHGELKGVLNADELSEERIMTLAT